MCRVEKGRSFFIPLKLPLVEPLVSPFERKNPPEMVKKSMSIAKLTVLYFVCHCMKSIILDCFNPYNAAGRIFLELKKISKKKGLKFLVH